MMGLVFVFVLLAFLCYRFAMLLAATNLGVVFIILMAVFAVAAVGVFAIYFKE